MDRLLNLRETPGWLLHASRGASIRQYDEIARQWLAGEKLSPADVQAFIRADEIASRVKFDGVEGLEFTGLLRDSGHGSHLTFMVSLGTMQGQFWVDARAMDSMEADNFLPQFLLSQVQRSITHALREGFRFDGRPIAATPPPASR